MNMIHFYKLLISSTYIFIVNLYDWVINKKFSKQYIKLAYNSSWEQNGNNFKGKRNNVKFLIQEFLHVFFKWRESIKSFG